MKRSVVFFCQASGDIVHILKKIDEIQNENINSSIRIFCFNNLQYSECFKFLQIKNIEAQYYSHLYPPISSPWRKFIWEKQVLNWLNNTNLIDSNQSIYFTSIYDDAATTYYVKLLLEKGIKVFYLNHYDDIQSITPVTHVKLIDRLRLLSYKFCTGIDYSLSNMANRWNVTRFPKEKYNIIELHPVLDKNVCSKYAYKCDNTQKNKILFFSQPNRDHELISDEEYNNLHIQMLCKLKEKGYFVVLKGHPAIGLCPGTSSYADLIIPQYIPSELIDLSTFNTCMAFMTIALASSAKMGIPSYSFLPLMKEHDSLNYNGALSFIKQTGDSKVILLSHIDEIKCE